MLLLIWEYFRELRGPLERVVQVKRANPSAHVDPRTNFYFDDVSSIRLGANVSIGAFSEISARTICTESRIPGGLLIGERTGIGAFANIRASGGTITIGPNCMIAQRVSMIASNHLVEPGKLRWDSPYDEKKAGIRIGKNVWVGTGAIILPGVTIGDNAVIGAGSVVTKSVPENEIWAGVPARKIRSL